MAGELRTPVHTGGFPLPTAHTGARLRAAAAEQLRAPRHLNVAAVWAHRRALPRVQGLDGKAAGPEELAPLPFTHSCGTSHMPAQV